MAVPTAYLTSPGKLKSVLEDVKGAGVPPTFTYAFLKQLGHQSSADRPIIAVLKALGFLTDSGTPTERYRRYKDSAQSRAVMAEAVREAYADVFTIDEKAYNKTVSQLQGIFARLSDKGDSVTSKMAGTFKALTDLADFSAPAPAASENKQERPEEATNDAKEMPTREEPLAALVLRHDVHVHLPVSTDINVYDAIFRALRENLG